ncbi:MAG: hypothetical protein ACPGU1_07245 [Myxococcota bacterium]
MKPFATYTALCAVLKSVKPLTTLLLVAVLTVGCSSASNTDLTPEGEIGAGALDGEGQGNGTVTGGDDTPPGEGAAEAVCGDGVCDPGEHTFNCRPDCEPGDYLLCLTGACPEVVQGCSASVACGDALVCLSQCDPDADDEASELCRSGCAANLGEDDAAAFQAILGCESDSDCRPDGPPPVVEPEVDPTLSCEGRCGEPASDERPCACDTSCVIFGDCCADYEAECVDAVAAECGDGACDDGEDAESCPDDCNGDGPPVSECGDGACDDDESADSCPDDCKGDGPAASGLVACLKAECSDEYAACLEDEGCVDILDCIEECPGGDQGCIFGCSQQGEFSIIAANMGSCGQQAGCFDDAPPGPSAECGDDICQEDMGENADNCPKDCGEGPKPPSLSECLDENCPEEMAACLGDDTCMQALACLEDCPAGDQNCLFECSQAGGFSMPAINLGLCGQNSGCFDAPAPGAECGDGVCQGDMGENPDTCPQDCGGQEGCIWEECGAELGACLETPSCAQLVECVQNCQSDNCIQGCANEAGQQAVDLYIATSDCYYANCEGEPFCGDGDCGQGENADNCPQDCGGGNPGGGVSDCLQDNCGEQYAECVGDASCLEALECIEDCPAGDQGCLFGCSQVAGFSQTAINVALCGQGAGCFEGGGGNGGGGECAPGCPNDWIGDDFCDQQCNVAACGFDDGDCGPDGPGGSEGAACIVEACNVGSQCQNSDSCFGAIECIAGCTNEGCVDDCVEDMQGGGQNYIANQVAPCALESGCLGGGGGPVDPPDSDLEECLTDNCGGQWSACMADAACADALPCLNACVAGGGTGCTYQCMPDQENEALLALGTCGGQNGCGNICGDGECDPGENADSCPQDCSDNGGGDNGGGDNGGGDNPGLECLNENCPGAVEDCTNSDCWSIFDCYNTCSDNDNECFNACYFNASNAAQNASQEIGACWEENSCANAGGGDNGGGGDATDEYFECLEDACGQQLNSCYTNGSQTCPATFNCADQCIEDGGSANECLPSCYAENNGSNSNTTTTLYECSAAATCHTDGGGDNGGGDNGGGDNGGGDNGGDVTDFVECVQDVCEDEVSACEANAQCADVLDCALNCAGDISCMIGCAGFEALNNPTIIDVGTCAQSSGCF